MLDKIVLLVVDDHPMIVKGYKVSIESSKNLPKTELHISYTIDEALKYLKRAKKNPYNIVLLDINLGPSRDGKIFDGEDLGKLIRFEHIHTKIIVSTMHNDPIRVSAIVKAINPEAFLIKTEVTPSLMEDVIMKVISGKRFFSPHVRKITNNNDHMVSLDEFDKKILYQISLGEKTKNLPNYIPFSLPTLERRKRNIKIAFGIPDGDDKELIAMAREKGFL